MDALATDSVYPSNSPEKSSSRILNNASEVVLRFKSRVLCLSEPYDPDAGSAESTTVFDSGTYDFTCMKEPTRRIHLICCCPVEG
jgi:hypothetical protein